MSQACIDDLNGLFKQCKDVWAPRWFKEFSDDESGGFHERLGEDSKPLPLPKRLLTQCRQIIVYSNHCQASPNEAMKQKVSHSFEFLRHKYRNSTTGGFHFSLGLHGEIEDAKYDLYGHAFVLLACAAMYKAFKNEESLIVAKETLNFIDTYFRLIDVPGFAEALDQNLRPLKMMRRQNPHMHLMEACVYMYEASQDAAYLAMAKEMLKIFDTYLFNKDDATLREFFDDNMGIHPTEGHLVEAGHQSEWVWLLARFQDVNHQADPTLIETMKKLFSWVVEHGFDEVSGGIYNSQSNDGTPVDTQKRIWPVLETLRAATIMSNIDGFSIVSEVIINRTLSLLRTYIASDGSWTEILSRDLKPATHYRPGTTPYHIYPPLQESVKNLKL